MAPRIAPHRVVIRGVTVAAVVGLWPSAVLSADLLKQMLRAADGGRCVETEAYVIIRARGPAVAAGVVRAALQAQARRREQQRSLGCAGDIAVQAIAAGADPHQVLRAAAAGL